MLAGYVELHEGTITEVGSIRRPSTSAKEEGEEGGCIVTGSLPPDHKIFSTSRILFGGKRLKGPEREKGSEPQGKDEERGEPEEKGGCAVRGYAPPDHPAYSSSRIYFGAKCSTQAAKKDEKKEE